MADDYLSSIGVVIYEGENCKTALLRHAKDHRWKPATLRRHLKNMNTRLAQGSDRLEWWNAMLHELGYESEPSLSLCRQAFRGIFINIYDLESGNYHKQHKNVHELRAYSRKNDLIYPREVAKKKGLNVFLKVLS